MKLLVTNHRGFFNRYHKNMPLFETILKDLSYGLLWVKNLIRNKGRIKNILVHPHYPSRGSTIYKVGKELGYNVTNKPNNNFEFAVFWEYNTHREEYHLLEGKSKSLRVINLFNRNISKHYIDYVHQEVFGYSTRINPLEHQGMLVRKNDTNALHDGVILEGPLSEKSDEYIYQILINNQEDGFVKDIRLPIVGSALDVCYLKYRPVDVRFTNQTAKAKLVDTKEVLSDEEIRLINLFCSKIHLEYGEIDILRDKSSQKIYIVDANNTPQGPPKNIPKEGGEKAIKELAFQLVKVVSRGVNKFLSH